MSTAKINFDAWKHNFDKSEEGGLFHPYSSKTHEIGGLESLKIQDMTSLECRIVD